MKKYYRFRVNVFWITIISLAMVATILYFKDDLYEFYKEVNGKETISLTGLQSELQNESECYLCGNSERSMMDYYRNLDTVGVLSINDWYILDFGLVSVDEDGKQLEASTGTRSQYGNTGTVEYQIESIPQMGVSEMKVTFPDDCKLDTTIIQEHLCQRCLDKILETLEIDKWKNESKEAIPLCLVDFQSLEVYPVQGVSQKYILKNCYVKVQNEKKSCSLFAVNND